MHRRGAKLVRILTGSSSSVLSITGRTITRPQVIALLLVEQDRRPLLLRMACKSCPFPRLPCGLLRAATETGAMWYPSEPAACGQWPCCCFRLVCQKIHPDRIVYPNRVCLLCRFPSSAGVLTEVTVTSAREDSRTAHC
ncbi:hypothetical protein B0T16DRAFT_84194 [Cercophora newfieldiana]|uniref:Uncharacterized protein n=1 Tax=Cercophora newfieldiana TaxID=92897 RepID=A0AA39YHL1_9PEZI|nr:hypothetical protein B0T16DRAFT_84194 [Cercophora newfieldiana]